MDVIAVLNDNNPQEHVLPFSLDLNQAITMRDTMKSGDGKEILYLNIINSMTLI